MITEKLQILAKELEERRTPEWKKALRKRLRENNPMRDPEARKKISEKMKGNDNRWRGKRRCGTNERSRKRGKQAGNNVRNEEKQNIGT